MMRNIMREVLSENFNNDMSVWGKTNNSNNRHIVKNKRNSDTKVSVAPRKDLNKRKKGNVKPSVATTKTTSINS